MIHRARYTPDMCRLSSKAPDAIIGMDPKRAGTQRWEKVLKVEEERMSQGEIVKRTAKTYRIGARHTDAGFIHGVGMPVAYDGASWSPSINLSGRQC